jgi:hypothetical protein
MYRLSILFAGALSVSALALASPACAAPVSARGAAAGVTLAPDSAQRPALQAAVLRTSGARPPAVVLADDHGFRGGHGEGEEHEHFDGHGGVFIGGGIGDPWWGYGVGWGPYWDPGFYGPGYYDYGDARPSSGLKIKVTGTDAKQEQVFVNGSYAGTVDDFNGIFQELHLRPGQYRMEIRASGFRPLDVNVLIAPGKTVTYRGELQPAG